MNHLLRKQFKSCARPTNEGRIALAEIAEFQFMKFIRCTLTLTFLLVGRTITSTTQQSRRTAIPN